MQDDEHVSQTPLWAPSEELAANSVLAGYLDWLHDARGMRFEGYEDLWRWSTENLEEFWESVWSFFGVRAHTPYTAVMGSQNMPGAQWFPGASLNYAEHALSHNLSTPAVIGFSEGTDPVELSWDDLRGQVGALAGWLTSHGVGPTDRVVGYLPNIPQAVVAFLACASIGALWSACSPEYTPQGAADRFAQLDPTVLIAADGYRYAGKVHDRRHEVEALHKLLPTIRTTLWLNHVDAGEAPPSLEPHHFDEVVATPVHPTYTPLPFDHPLWVLYSSGTTGRPKGIVHGHGGITLEHLKYLGFHLDLHPGTRFSWYTSTSWMMWNIQVSGLLHGATIVLYDGSPGWPDTSGLWRLAQDAHLDFLGTSAAYLLSCQNEGLCPRENFNLQSLQALGSTGSPLPASGFEWVYESVGEVWFAPASGGTDIASGFAGGVPTLPVYAGQMQGRLLGVAMQAWDEAGHPLANQVGELVVTQPMPSMPLYFWDDHDGSRYHDAYFDTYPGVWRHGDWVTIASDGGVVVHGRSDATMNKFGVRMGSAEIYEAIERLPEIEEALVVGVEQSNGGYWMPLFVTLRTGCILDSVLSDKVRATIRSAVSPRHVPDEVIAVRALPHTRTGKRLEVPVKRLLQGVPIDQAANLSSVDDPDALIWFATLGAERSVNSPTASG